MGGKRAIEPRAVFSVMLPLAAIAAGVLLTRPIAWVLVGLCVAGTVFALIGTKQAQRRIPGLGRLPLVPDHGASPREGGVEGPSPAEPTREVVTSGDPVAREDLPDWLSGREAEVRRLQGTLTKQLAEPYFDVRQVERTADTFQRVNNDVAHKLRLEASEEAAAQFEANPDWFDPVPTRLRPQEFQEVARLMGYAADQIARARVQINRAKQTGAAGALALRVRDEARQGWQLRDRVLADPMARTDMSLRYDSEIEAWTKRVVDLLAGAGEGASAHHFLARVPSSPWSALGIQGNQCDRLERLIRARAERLERIADVLMARDVASPKAQRGSTVACSREATGAASR